MDTGSRDPLLGRTLDGRYAVEELIARGGMASVYRGTDTRLGRTVALKVMAPAFAEDPEFVARFAREAQAAAGIYDGNVVIVHDQGDDDGVLYLVMEYVAGRTLRQLLQERGRLSSDEALDVLEPVLAALAAAHRKGLVHRDVKPENVLIGRDGHVKVTDFGLAKVSTGTPASQKTQGVLLGTMAYLAPEQTRGIADARTDVYSAGVLLYEMLVGRPPYEDDTALGLAYRHVTDVVPAPSAAVPTVPQTVDAVVASFTRRDPDERPVDAAAALHLVEDARRGVLPPPPAAAPMDQQPTLVVPLPTAGQTTTSAVPVAASPAPVPVDGVVVATGSGAPSPRKGRGWVALVLVVALAVLVGSLAWWLGSGRYTSVPGVVGMTAKQAEAALEEQGLAFTYAPPAFSEIVPEGKVVASDPEPGGRVADGGTVTLTLSKGPERYEVPKLAGLTLDQAEQRLSGLTLTVGTVTKAYSQTVPEGRVVGSSPKAGVEVRADTAIDLVVSRGLPPVEVPSVVGKSFDQANDQLAGLGLQIRKVDQQYQDGTTVGEILSQDPAAGARVEKGATVEVVVSLGPPLVQVPSVFGQSLNEAKKTLHQAGFKVRVVYDCGAFGCLGWVNAQSPAGGDLAPKGATVTITVV